MITSDKRKAERVDYTSDVSAYTIIASKSGNIFEVNSKPQTIPAVDISCSGIRLATSHPFADEAILKLKLELRKKQPVDVFARVVWSNHQHVGLKFIILHEEAQRDLAHFTLPPH
jgi:hypothetical protein